MKKSLTTLHERGITWLGKVRFRAAVVIVGLPLAVMGVVSIGPGWLALPLVGMAFAAATMTLSRLTSKLGEHTCWTCGEDLSGQPQGVHGVACHKCGSLNQHNPVWKNDLLAIDTPGDDDEHGDRAA